MNKAVKQLLIWVVVIACLVALNAYLGKNMVAVDGDSGYTEVLSKAQKADKVVTIDGGTTWSGTIPATSSSAPQFQPCPEMYTIFRAHGVNISNRDQNSGLLAAVMLVSIVPFGCGGRRSCW